DSTGGVARERAGEFGIAALDHLPAFARAGDVVAFQPHRLVPTERHVELGHVDFLARNADPRLAVDVVRALDARERTNRITAGEDAELTADGRGRDPRRRL